MTTDAVLVARTQDGDEEAFRALYERHRPAVERVCRKWLRDPYLVEEAVQATFVKAWTALPKFAGGAEVDRWLTRIAKNHCHDVWRGLARAEALGSAEESVADHADPSSLRLANDCVERVAVETMLRNLGRRDASLLVQRHISDVPVNALAAQWGLTRGAMDVALHRARVRARRLASAEGLRGLLPLGLLRRALAAVQRVGTSGDAGVVIMGVCHIAVAVTLSVPDVPPAYADAQATKTGGPAAHRVLAARSFAAADRALGDAPLDIRAAGSGQHERARPSVQPASPVTTSSARQPRNASEESESYVDFEPVSVPGGETSIRSRPQDPDPGRSLVLEPTGTEVEENDDPSLADPARPVHDAACTLADAGDPLTSCRD